MEGDGRVALDRDVVVVVDEAQAVQPLESREGGGLGGDALFEVAVAGDDPDAVVEGALAVGRVGVEKTALVAGAHRHPDGRGHALAQRTRRRLDTHGMAVLWMTRRAAAPRAERLEIAHRQPVVGQEELAVEGEARVPRGQHEPVAAQPRRVLRVVPHGLLEQEIRDRRQAHRRARMAVADALDGVHRQRPYVGHRPVVVF